MLRMRSAIAVTGFVVLAIGEISCSPDPTAKAANGNRPLETPGEGYSTSDTCRSCHPGEYASWHSSYHRTMTQPATPATVLGDFDDVGLPWGGTEIVLARRGDRFFAQLPGQGTSNGAPAAPEEHEVVLVTGRHHLQIYWYETGKTRVLADLPFAWDVSDERWFPADANFIKPPLPEGAELAASVGNWNQGCISCHVTDARPKWLGPPHAMTEASEFGIACEACHGPAKDHVEQMRDPRDRYEHHLQDARVPGIANPARMDTATSSEVCGRCHSVWRHASNEAFADYLRDGIDFEPGESLSDSKIVVIQGHANDPGSFWPDGEVKPSGREYNGLIDSPCYADGQFSCMSCHSMHAPTDEASLAEWRNDQLAPGMDGDLACLQCHDSLSNPEAIVAHTHHPSGSPGSACQNCHMPFTNLGLRKAIRSHTISSPNVKTDQATGRPNACNGCHLDKSIGWVAGALTAWYGHDAPDLTALESGVPAAAVDLLSGDAALRALAASALGWGPAVAVSNAESWAPPLLAQTLKDPYPAVRYHAKRSLLAIPGYEDITYDWVGSPSSLTESAERVTRRWLQRRRDSGEPTHLDFLLTDTEAQGPPLTSAIFEKLARARDDRPVEVRE
jgi:hypothetical protein